MAPLERALALAEMDRVAGGVAQELDLDVAGTREVALEDEPIVAERGRGLAPRAGERLGQLVAPCSTTCMPLPPPPALGLISTG